MNTLVLGLHKFAAITCLAGINSELYILEILRIEYSGNYMMKYRSFQHSATSTIRSLIRIEKSAR